MALRWALSCGMACVRYQKLYPFAKYIAVRKERKRNEVAN